MLGVSQDTEERSVSGHETMATNYSVGVGIFPALSRSIGHEEQEHLPMHLGLIAPGPLLVVHAVIWIDVSVLSRPYMYSDVMVWLESHACYYILCSSIVAFPLLADIDT